jgi:hypothetical protein
MGRGSYFVPRPTVGGSYNVDGRTSYAYIGATWTVDITAAWRRPVRR